MDGIVMIRDLLFLNIMIMVKQDLEDQLDMIIKVMNKIVKDIKILENFFSLLGRNGSESTR